MNWRKCKEFQRNVSLGNQLSDTDSDAVETIVMLDISFKSGKAYKVVVLFAVADKTIIGVYTGIYDNSILYVPTFLAFRKASYFFRLLKSIPAKFDVVFCDGHGIMHPYRFGETKSALCDTFLPPVTERHSLSTVTDNGELSRYAFANRVWPKSIFISPGHKISFENSLELVTMVSGKFRVPIPLYSADRASKQLCKQGIV